MNLYQIKVIVLSFVIISFTSCKEGKASEVVKVKSAVAKIADTKEKVAVAKTEQAVAKQESTVKKEAKKTETVKPIVKEVKKPEIKKTVEKKPIQKVEQPVVKKQVITGPAVETLTPEAFKKMIEGGHVQLLDIRTKREFVANRIKGAVNFDVYKRTFISDVEAGGIKKDEPIYIYCLTGGRTGSAKNMLAKAGYKKVYELQGGIKYWYQKGFKIEK